MASARFAWGIDIGNRALKAIRLVRTGDNLKIDDFDVIEHEQILSNAGENYDTYIQNSLANFASRHNLKGGVVAVGVSGQNSFARFIKLPPVEKKKIPEIVRFEAIQQIPFPLEDVEWSYQLFETPESPDVEVGIFAMRKELVEKHIKFFTDADLKVVTVQMNPLAVYNAMQHDGRLKDTTMIIDMGAENTDLIIADNDSVWLRSIPIGGNSFTEALVKAFKLNFAKAEELKRTAGTSKYTRQIFQAMRPIFADLVGEIQRSMGFFSSVRRETRIKQIIALGSTFRLPNLLRYLQQNLQLDVAKMDGFRSGVPSDPKAAATFNENLLSLAGAYGLAVQAMGDGKIQSSLLPETIRRERMWKEKTKWFAAAAALMVAGTGIAYGSVYLRAAAEDTQARTQNDQLLSQAESLSQRWAALQSGGADKDLLKKYYDLTDYRMLWPNLLQDIRAAVPEPQLEVKEGLMKWDANLVKKVERGDRELLVLDGITTQYTSNLGSVLKSKDFAKMAGGGGSASAAAAGSMAMGPMGPMGMAQAAPAAESSGAPARGFLVTVRCITPHANAGQFVQAGFVDQLKKIVFPKTVDPTRNYMVARAEIVSTLRLSDDPAKLADIQATYDAVHGNSVTGPMGSNKTLRRTQTSSGGTAMGAGSGAPRPMGYGSAPPGWFRPPVMGGAGAFAPPTGRVPGMAPSAGNTEENQPKHLDPLTEEDVSGDWIFTVLFAVVIDPTAEMVAEAKPATPPAGSEQPAGEASASAAVPSPAAAPKKD